MLKNKHKTILKEGTDEVVFPFGPSIFKTHITDELNNYILDESEKLDSKVADFRKGLAGNFINGTSLKFSQKTRKEIEPYLKDKVNTWFEMLLENNPTFNGINKMMNKMTEKEINSGEAASYGNLRLETLWINFQGKNDYNPPHTHSGDISFVIYNSVPKEIFTKQAVTNTAHAGRILFNYGEDMPLSDKGWSVEPYNNLMFLFPAYLTHYVPPFYTDSTRISTSGNLTVIK